MILIIILMEKGPNKFKPLFKEYRRFRPLFQKELEKEALPKHQFWDYKILLMEKKKSKSQHIYLLSEKELQVLREYINENLKKNIFDPRFY